MADYRIRFSDEAFSDLRDITEYYLENGGAEVVRDFARELAGVTNKIVESPLHTRVFRKIYRERYMKKFEYRVVYVVSGELIEIVAIVHQRRHLRTWRKRLQ